VAIVGAEKPELKIGVGGVFEPEGVDVCLCCAEISAFGRVSDGERVAGAVFGTLGKLELGGMDNVGLGILAVEKSGVGEHVFNGAVHVFLGGVQA